MKLHSGIPDIRMYEDLIVSESFLEIEKYADTFLKKYSFLKDHYSWVKDPLHQWSRQWEYPFILNCINECLAENKNQKAIVLDAGAGITFFPYLVNELDAVDRVICQDIDQGLGNLYDQVNKSYQQSCPHFTAGEMQSLQFKSDTFDVVYSISVLEHTDNYFEIIKELHRVLKKNGVLILTFDIGLDGVSDISPGHAQSLLNSMSKYFQFEEESSNSIQYLIKQSSNQLVTSSGIGKTRCELLPWKFPFLSLVKSALKARKIPAKLSKNLTFYCGVFKKI